MTTQNTPHKTGATTFEVRRMVAKLVALEVIKPDFWGVISIHIRNGCPQHIKMEQTLKLEDAEQKAEG